MKITITGTGTSQGVPVIGCDCEVCTSQDPRNKRLRTSAVIKVEGLVFSIDCGPDFRQQMLRARVQSLDALLITHEHNDHIIGLDDVRPFNFMHRTDIPVYGSPRVLEVLRRRFAYIFEKDPYPGAPRIGLHPVFPDHPFEVKGVRVIPVEVMHGSLPVLGFRIGNFAYVTDVKTIAPGELRKLENLDILVISALHHHEHHSHLNLDQALKIIRALKPGRTYLVHMSHRMGLHAEVEAAMPSGVHLAYDGMQIDI